MDDATFKKVLERSISDWDGKDHPEDMEDHHASDNEDGEDVKVDVMNPLVHQNDGRWPRFIGGASPADIKQGDANDCWLLSAMMIAAARDKDAEEKERYKQRDRQKYRRGDSPCDCCCIV